MAVRKQNLILFFDENEEYNVINSRLVRLYMNRFTIDIEDETEITGIYEVKDKTWKNYQQLLSESFNKAKEYETKNTDTHFIFGNSSLIDLSLTDSKVFQENFKYLYTYLRDDSLMGNIINFMNENQSYSNCSACTILHGSHSLKFFPKGHVRIKYDYEEQSENRNIHAPFVHHTVAPIKYEWSINDDLEWFRLQIRDLGLNHRHLMNEVIQLFHFQRLDEDQIDELKVSIKKFNNNLSFFKRLYAYHSFTETEANESYLLFNCKRLTYYF